MGYRLPIFFGLGFVMWSGTIHGFLMRYVFKRARHLRKPVLLELEATSIDLRAPDWLAAVSERCRSQEKPT